VASPKDFKRSLQLVIPKAHEIIAFHHQCYKGIVNFSLRSTMCRGLIPLTNKFWYVCTPDPDGWA
jgi:hypothetical protein